MGNSLTFNSLIGRAQVAIDEKGRSSFPREFRQQLDRDDMRDMVLPIGPDRTLSLYVMDEFQKFMNEINARPRTRKTLDLQRMIKGYSSLVKIDGQNRISIPRELQEYAGLTDSVLFVGRSGQRIVDLWNPEAYNRLYAFKTESDFQAFNDAFLDDGFAMTEDAANEKR